jgi:RNA polymerase-binding transcription factor DksA
MLSATIITMINKNYFQKKLEDERMELETDLQKVARTNPEDPNDWQATPAEDEKEIRQDADPNVAADAIEDFEERSGVESVLENRLHEVKDALNRIEKNNYGICDVCEKEIEEERLEANPAANTCKEHIDK